MDASISAMSHQDIDVTMSVSQYLTSRSQRYICMSWGNVIIKMKLMSAILSG